MFQLPGLREYAMNAPQPRDVSAQLRLPAATTAAGYAGEVMTGHIFPASSHGGLAAYVHRPSGRPSTLEGEIPGRRAYHGAVTVGGKPTGVGRDAILRFLGVPARSGGNR